MLARLRAAVSGPKGWFGLIPGWLLLVAAVWLPQVLASGDATVVGVLLGLLLTTAWVGLMVVVGWSTIRGLIGAGVGVVEIALMHGLGSGEWQAALALEQGRALDGVTLADAFAQRDAGLWIRLTDARVRSEGGEDLHFVSGGGRDAKGGMRSTTSETVAVAPVSLASSVPNENPMMRGTMRGEVWLWACATSSTTLRSWDSERQAVRGRLEPMESHVVESLAKEIGPTRAAPIPGAGAIAAAPGATTPTAAPVHYGMWLPAQAWCVHLDRALDAAAATEQARATAFGVGLTVPVFIVLLAFGVARSRPDPKRR